MNRLVFVLGLLMAIASTQLGAMTLKEAKSYLKKMYVKLPDADERVDFQVDLGTLKPKALAALGVLFQHWKFQKLTIIGVSRHTQIYLLNILSHVGLVTDSLRIVFDSPPLESDIDELFAAICEIETPALELFGTGWHNEDEQRNRYLVSVLSGSSACKGDPSSLQSLTIADLGLSEDSVRFLRDLMKDRLTNCDTIDIRGASYGPSVELSLATMVHEMLNLDRRPSTDELRTRVFSVPGSRQ